MADVSAKCDRSLFTAYAVFKRNGQAALGPGGSLHGKLAPGNRIGVKLFFSGDIDPALAAGFELHIKRSDTEADGSIALERLEELASLPQVLRIEHGEDDHDRDISVADINARGPAATAVWDINATSGTFTGRTGAGVVVGIIDSGIDFRHNHFMSVLTPQRQTRIRRIWDMGLIRQAGEKEPTAESLGWPAGTPTYGVVYDDTDINTALHVSNPPNPVRHRDCNGHGTHVASIAAGRGHDGFTNVGVAPGADIVVVKISSHFIPLARNYPSLFKDAIQYILNVARLELGNKPVVINYSRGSNTGAHDGNGWQETIVNAIFGGASTSRAIVISAGNDGFDRQHHTAKVSSVASNVVVELYDTRQTIQMSEYRSCRQQSTTVKLSLAMWYAEIPGNVVSGSLTAPTLPSAINFPLLGGRQTNNPYGPTNRHSISMAHETVVEGGVSRCRMSFEVSFFADAHVKGDYIIQLTSTLPTDVEMWCSGAAVPLGFRFKNPSTSNNEKLIGNGGAEHAITVAAYATRARPAVPADGIPAMVPGDLAYFSSRGPMVQYTAAPVPTKPDISAPGVRIFAAKSAHSIRTDPRSIIPSIAARSELTPKGGTSMAAPHVAGVVALMLEKNPTLTTAQIKTLLKTHFRPMPATGTAFEWGAGKVDAKKVHDHA